MFSKLKNILIELGSLGPVLAFTILAPGGGIFVLSLTHENWLPLFDAINVLNLSLFVLTATVLAGVSLVPTHAVSLISGLIFGFTFGSSIALFSVVLASVVSFFITEKIIGDKAIKTLIKRPQANAIYNELLKHDSKRTIAIVSLIRLSPIMPFAGTNVLLAAAKVKLSEFLAGSAIGLAPRIILVVLAGAELSKLDFSEKGSQSLLILGVLATIMTLIVIGHFTRKALSHLVNPSREINESI